MPSATNNVQRSVIKSCSCVCRKGRIFICWMIVEKFVRQGREILLEIGKISLFHSSLVRMYQQSIWGHHPLLTSHRSSLSYLVEQDLLDIGIRSSSLQVLRIGMWIAWPWNWLDAEPLFVVSTQKNSS